MKFSLVGTETTYRLQFDLMWLNSAILFDRVENSVGKGENAGYQHFLLFLQCFWKASFLELFKIGIVW